MQIYVVLVAVMLSRNSLRDAIWFPNVQISLWPPAEFVYNGPEFNSNMLCKEK